MKALIVDDNQEIADLLAMILGSMAEIKDMANDGVEALDKVTTALDDGEPYDLIMMDIMMPNMDGHETLGKIREIEEEYGIMIGDGSKIVMITALGDGENVFGAFHREGCDGYIVKPFEKNQIYSELDRIGVA